MYGGEWASALLEDGVKLCPKNSEELSAPQRPPRLEKGERSLAYMLVCQMLKVCVCVCV